MPLPEGARPLPDFGTPDALVDVKAGAVWPVNRPGPKLTLPRGLWPLDPSRGAACRLAGATTFVYMHRGRMHVWRWLDGRVSQAFGPEGAPALPGLPTEPAALDSADWGVQDAVQLSETETAVLWFEPVVETDETQEVDEGDADADAWLMRGLVLKALPDGSVQLAGGWQRVVHDTASIGFECMCAGVVAGRPVLVGLQVRGQEKDDGLPDELAYEAVCFDPYTGAAVEGVCPPPLPVAQLTGHIVGLSCEREMDPHGRLSLTVDLASEPT